MKKILFLIHTLGGGGAEKALVNLVNVLPRDQWDITVQTIVNTGKYRSELPRDVAYRTFLSLPILSRPESKDESGSLLSAPGKFKTQLAKVYSALFRVIPSSILHKIIVRGSYDIEIAYLEGICTKVISGSASPATKTYAWVHVDLEQQRKSHAVYPSLEREGSVWDTFSSIVCVSNSVSESFVSLFPDLKGKVFVCHNIIKADEVRNCASNGSSVVEKKRFTFVSVGRLNYQKGYDRLLRVCVELYSAGYDFDVWIIGSGTMQTELQAFVDNNGISGKVKLLGYLENPLPTVAEADVFIAPSRTEGISTVVAEALILHKPVVATNCSGMSELLGNSERGLIVDNSEIGIKTGMCAVMDSPATLKLYKDAASKGCLVDEYSALNEFLTLVDKG